MSPWLIIAIVLAPFIAFVAWAFVDIARNRRDARMDIREPLQKKFSLGQRHADVFGVLFLIAYALLLFGGWIDRGGLIEAVLIVSAGIAYVSLWTAGAIRNSNGVERRDMREIRLVLFMLIAFGVLLGVPGLIAAIRGP